MSGDAPQNGRRERKNFAHARLYDADLGRMLSKDPVKRGLNGYPYCGNDPVNHTDPTGEIPTVLVFGAGGGGLSNAVSGAIFGNVPFKNAGEAFGKGALAGVAFFGVGKAVEALKGSLNRGSKGGTGHGYLVDSTMFPDDEAAGVLGNREYVKNPTAHNINDYISEGSNYLGSKNMNGQYMYVVDMDGNIIIGTRGGQRMPHPTLVGGGNPQVQAAGIVEIRGGKIYSINNASGHFKPSVESLGIAEDAFSNLQQNIFSQDFQGYLPYGE